MQNNSSTNQSTPTKMKYFLQIDADEHNEILNWLLKDELLFRVLFVCARRSRKSEDPHPTLGLIQWEFLISETETEVFGLKKTQKGKLSRSILKLIQLKLISKTGKRTGNANSTIYVYNKDNPITFGLQTGNEIGSEQGANRERTGSEQGQSYKGNKEIKKKSNNNLNGKLPKSNYALFVDLLKELKGRKFGYGDPKAKRQFEYLIKQKYTREDFKKVIMNAYADKHHIESNFQYLTPEFLTRVSIFERYLNIQGKEIIPEKTEAEKLKELDDYLNGKAN